MKRPGWFMIVVVLLLLWGAAGVFACIQQFRLGAEAMGPASDYDRALYARLPVWYNAIYAVAVGTGFLAALALLFRSVLAVPLAAISIVAILVQFGWLFAATDIIAAKGVFVTYFPAVILAIGVFALWLARRARARRWIA
ncbi:hypothetical protein [Sphingomonas corticis]|jgi:hypothetical protein|uniref:Sugar transporter n=1 Tax=Sphingomonas corticis TaxID=2722791 RepID=A0ABX1CM36_9SPHN|nr:hypothetical protein [Sphingomonas corticis]NJR77377.1 hypothetical protein [Sphingomonas corticis]